MTISTYEINTPDIVAEDFDGQVVILNLANGHYFSLEGCAGDIWALLCAGHSVEAILEGIRNAAPEMHDHCAAFVQELIRGQLIRPAPITIENQKDINVLWANDPPRLETYDDLAELIYADPIHDVDEQAGWPVPRRDK